MIIDDLVNLQHYVFLHPRFEKAFAYIQSTNLLLLEKGETQIDGDDIKAIGIEAPLQTKEESIAGFECHNVYIDIQVCIKGIETIGWKPRKNCLHPKGQYSVEKDVLLFEDKPDMYFQLQEGQFGIYFPDDVHAPMIGEGMIKKLVMKIRC
jgi:biofilm protein TabA